MLSISPNYSNNINFTSKIRLNPKGLNRSVWQEVAKDFEKSTKKSNYEFYLTDNGKTIKIEAETPAKSGGYYQHGIELNTAATAHIRRYDKSTVAKILVTLQNIYKHADNTRESAYKYLETMHKNDKFGTLHKYATNDYTHYEQILLAVTKKSRADVLAGLKNDNLLYDSDVLY